MNEVYVVEIESDFQERDLHPKFFKTLEQAKKFAVNNSYNNALEYLADTETVKLAVEEEVCDRPIFNKWFCFIVTYHESECGDKDYITRYWISKLEEAE